MRDILKYRLHTNLSHYFQAFDTAKELWATLISSRLGSQRNSRKKGLSHLNIIIYLKLNGSGNEKMNARSKGRE